MTRIQDSLTISFQLRDYQVELGASPRAIRTLDNYESTSDVDILEIGYPLAVELKEPSRRLSGPTGNYAQALITGCTVCLGAAGRNRDTASLTFSCCSSMSSVPSMTVNPSCSAMSSYCSMILAWNIL